MDYFILTREELYTAVWETPIVELAKQLGLSNTALANKCVKYKIPRPGAGYWSHIKHGQRPRIPAFTKLDQSTPEKKGFIALPDFNVQ
ncbi:hypothetical protein [Aliikangiella sp. IMCC44632]